MTMSSAQAPLFQLAEAYGVETSYHDIWGQQRTASTEALIQVLRALGAPLASESDVSAALRHRQEQHWTTRIQPTIITWSGALREVELRIPARIADARCSAYLTLESGEQHSWTVALGDLPTTDHASTETGWYLIKQLEIPHTLPHGYHRLTIDLAGQRDQTTIISAPIQAWTGGARAAERRWGVFMPLHALRTARTPWGGNLTDLEALSQWAGRLGGSLVGTLPLLAAFLDEPFDPSPYAPASRLLWNELFLDPRAIPDFQHSDAARILLATAPAPPPTVDEPRRLDYRPWATHQRAVLETLAEAFFSSGGNDPAFTSYLREHPRVADYARFRAAAEHQRTGWIVWPDSQRDGTIREDEIDPARARYHEYVQWRMEQQLSSLSSGAAQSGAALYLDFPLGVHPDSYDTWRERSSFASGISVGAPPDMFFTAGQDWGFPPLHPERARIDGYGYLREAIRGHMRHAGALRIDHVMGLHRLYWIPHGLGATEGVYVRYPAENLYAILALESTRAECLIIGEDLGTVPDSVRQSMDRHELHRMYVTQFEVNEEADHAVNPPAVRSMASLNTHDTVLFQGFWDGLDVDIMRRLGLISDDDHDARQDERSRVMRAVCEFLRRHGLAHGEDSSTLALHGLLRYLAASHAQMLMVTLEDLWLEPLPQNVPGTGDDWGNWRRSSRLSLEQVTTHPGIQDLLQEINRLRSAG